jgi:hypothetical protein
MWRFRDTWSVLNGLHIGLIIMLLMQDMLLMRMRPIFSSSPGQSRTKKLDEDWQEQFFKLNVTHIFDQQVT